MTTTLILVRHAQPETHVDSDALGPHLSDNGKMIHTHTTQKLMAQTFEPSIIYSSPLHRAQETAQIMSVLMGAPVTVEAALGDQFDEQILMSLIPEPDAKETIAMVGHAPYLLALTQTLCEVCPIDSFPKSSAVVIEFKTTIAAHQGTFLTQIAP